MLHLHHPLANHPVAAVSFYAHRQSVMYLKSGSRTALIVTERVGSRGGLREGPGVMPPFEFDGARLITSVLTTPWPQVSIQVYRLVHPDTP